LRRFRYLGVSVLLFAAAALPASSYLVPNLPPSTKAFSIDGKRFLLEKTASSNLSLLREELLKQGIDVPLGKDESIPSNPSINGIAREEETTSPLPSLPLPEGLRAEHMLRTESGRVRTDIVFGIMEAPGKSLRNWLSSSGWDCLKSGLDQGVSFVATLKKGRETFVVFLEEKERRFLLLHHMEE